MGRRLVVVRHGQTAWNAENRLQGQADIELAEAGRVQAKEVAEELLAHHTPVALWASDLLRARQTAEALGERTGLPVRTDHRLREIHVGELQAKTHDEARAAYGPGPWDYALYGGEGQRECGERVAAGLRDVAAALPEDATAVVVSHGACIRLGAAAFLEWPDSVAASLAGLDNCAWVELVEGSSSWIRRSGGPGAAWRLAAYNRTA